METDGPALLKNSEGGDPKRNEAILAEGKPKAGVSDDLKCELAVAPGMRKLIVRRTSQGDATEDKGTGLVGEFLPAVCAVLTNEADGVEFLETVPGEPN